MTEISSPHFFLLSPSPTGFKPKLWTSFMLHAIKTRFLNYDWHSNVTFLNNKAANLPGDFWATVVVAIIIGIIHILSRRLIFRNILAKKLLSPKGYSPGLLLKFETACWKFLAYGFLTCYGVFALYDEDWVWNPDTYLQGWSTTHVFHDKLRLYYILVMGFYLFSTIAIFFEPKMKDFYQMFFHHLVTMILVGCSYLLGYFRIGVIVMILHDISDPIMEIAKIFHYGKNELMANVFFVMFAGVFFYTRLYLFAIHVVQNSMYVTLESRVIYPYGIECTGFLMCLQGLHVFWSSLILKMIVEAIAGGGVQGDTREDKDD